VNRRPVPPEPLSAGDQVLRAAVYAAFDAKGTPEFDVAVREVVFVHRTWPLIAYAHAIDEAHVECDRVADWHSDGLELMRASYGGAAV